MTKDLEEKDIKSILVIEDDEIQVAYILNLLAKSDYKTTFAFNGETALSDAFKNRYDLILVDISLPDMDGFEICRKLKSHPFTKNTPLVFLSGFTDEIMYKTGYKIGAIDYLKKPIYPAEFMYKIKTYLKHAKTEKDLRQSKLLLSSIVNDQEEFIIRYKPDGTLTFINKAFSLFLNKPVHEIIGDNFFKLLNIDEESEMRSMSLTSKIPQRISNIEIVGTNGKVSWYKWVQRRIVDVTTNEIIIQSIGINITETKKKEDILHMYEFIFKNAAVGIAAGSRIMFLDMVNEAYAKMHGYTVEELIGKKANIVYADKSDHFLMDAIVKTIRNGNYSYKSIHARKDGTEFPVLSELTMINDENGNNQMLIANVQDITESTRANNALVESELRFRTIFMNSPNIMAIVRVKDMHIMDVNDRYVDFFGNTKEEVLTNQQFLLAKYEDRSEIESIMRSMKDNSGFSNFETRVKAKDNKYHPVQIACSKIILNGEEHIVAILSNISVIKEFEQSLQASETKFRLLADYNYNWEFWLDSQGNYIYISPSCERISGYTMHELMNKPKFMLKLIHPDFLEICSDHFKNEHLNSGPEYTVEMLIIDKSGREKWISHNCNPVFDESGKFLGRRGSNRDITQKMLAEKQLLKLSTAIEQISTGICITDTGGVIEYVNPFLLNMTGYKPEEVLGKKANLFKSGKTDSSVYDGLWDSLSNGEIWEGEFINKRKDEELYIEHAIITPVKDKNSKIVNYIAIKQDITRQKEMEREILQTIITTEEKERVRFAQDLHDDLGPLLSTAKLYVKSFETIKDVKNKQYAIDKSIQAIDEAIMSIKEIANNLSPHVLRDFGLISGINSLVTKINETGSLGIVLNSEIEERFSENIESSLFRVVSELINNTVKHAFARNVEINIKRSESGIAITYSDDGVGFKLERALRKKLSRGLLNIINRLKSIGGEISFDNNSKGTRAYIIVPIGK